MAKGFFVLFGAPGTGKSTEAAETFRDALYISSSPNVIQFYRQLGMPLPKREIVVDMFSIDKKTNFDAQGMPVPVDTKATLENLLRQVVAKTLTEAAKGLPLTYRNIVIDEAGEFWTRVLNEITPTVKTKGGAIDTRGAYGVMGKWSNECLKFLSQVLNAGANVCLVAHAQEPEASEDKKGGPKFPSQAIMGSVCALADGVLLRVVEDAPPNIDKPGEKLPPLRLWRAHASERWLSKLRGLPDSAFEEVKLFRLKQILERAGFEP